MLNYIWTALIFLGLAAAISYDISDSVTNKYRNGGSLTIKIKSNEIVSKNVNKQYDARIFITFMAKV
jgi:spore maturation protein SpmA